MQSWKLCGIMGIIHEEIIIKEIWKDQIRFEKEEPSVCACIDRLLLVDRERGKCIGI